MFHQITKSLLQLCQGFSGKKLTESTIQAALKPVKTALLDADVSLSVVESFLRTVADEAVNTSIDIKVKPDQWMVKVVNDALIKVMGEQCAELNLRAATPVVILVAGLQGSGKTTTVAKLSHFLKERHKKRVMVTSVDVYRPAAMEQLSQLAEQAGVFCHKAADGQKPVSIIKEAINEAKKTGADVLIIDTAGRMHVDDAMMAEIIALHKTAKPTETLFVVDSMTGQDAVNTATQFNNILPLTGVILTKTDSDSRGGAALSIRHVTGKPIKFMGVGEKISALEAFYPDRVASRILGMGDILTLIEEAQINSDQKKKERMMQKMGKGHPFDFDDLLTHVQSMSDMGGARSIISKIPNFMSQSFNDNDVVMCDKEMTLMRAMIYSMTPKERKFPDLVRNNPSRKKRIVKGSGASKENIVSLFRFLDKMHKISKAMRNPKMKKAFQAIMSGDTDQSRF